MTSSDWPTAPLATLVDPDRGISYGVVQPGTHVEDGVPIVRVANVKNGTVSTADPLRVSSAVEALHSRTRLRGGELLMTLVGTVGETAIASPDLAGWNVARAIGVIPVREDVGPQWVRYALDSQELRSRISSRLNTTVQATLNLRDVGALPIPMPSQSLRSAITSILGAIDDKIGLNRRINTTLETMARALFKDWFIDFEPVHAKMKADRPPYLASDVWDSFPASFAADVPAGWNQMPLDAIATFLNGLALQKFPPDGRADLPAIKIANLRAGVALGGTHASGDVPEQYVIHDGDVIFSWSGSLLQRLWTGGRGALNQHLFKVTSERYPKWFHYLWVDHHMPEFQRIAAAKATTMGHIQRHHLTAAAVVVPTERVLKAANAVLAPILEAVIRNDVETRDLGAMRDLLLPKLMSGDIRIKDAERFIEEATA